MLVSNLSNDSFNYRNVFTEDGGESKDPEFDKIDKLMLSKFNEKGELTEKDFEEMADLYISNAAEWGKYTCHLGYIIDKLAQEMLALQPNVSPLVAGLTPFGILHLMGKDPKVNKEVLDSLAEFEKKEKEGKQKIVDILKGSWECKKGQQDRVTKQFYSLFFNEESAAARLLPQEINLLFKTYLSDGSITVEKDQNGRSFLKINSMHSVIRFLEDHPDITFCNFQPFEIDIKALPPFAEFLKNSTQVECVFFLDTIPEDARIAFAEAEDIRNSTDSDGNPLGVYFEEE